MAGPAAPAAHHADRNAQHAIWGAFVGFLIDNFDIYLPVVALGPAISYFVAPQLGAGTISIVTAGIFVATLLGRPLGALIFGRFADTIGRRRTTIVAVSGFGVATLLIALLPGYEQWGLTSVIALIVLRFIDGVFLGGEYTAASPLAMEYSPRHRRGLYGGLIQTGATLAFVIISLLTLLMLKIAPAGDVHSAYVQWGWRVPFFIGAALAFVFVVYYRFRVSESELWQPASSDRHPLRSLFRGANLRSFGQVFILMTGLWFVLDAVTAILPGLLRKPVGLTSSQITLTLVVLYLVLTAGFVAGGVVSQHTGRRPYLVITGAVATVAGTACFYLLIRPGTPALGTTIGLATLTALLVVVPWAVITPYINERFHTDVRASGFGLGYSLAVIIPSFYAFYQQWLTHVMPSRYTVLVLVVFGGLLICGGALLGPETKDVEFTPVSSATKEAAIGRSNVAETPA